ncbi:MAG: hypothetical protein ACP5VE_02955 [Chthonomonadales bacterium]
MTECIQCGDGRYVLRPPAEADAGLLCDVGEPWAFVMGGRRIVRGRTVLASCAASPHEDQSRRQEDTVEAAYTHVRCWIGSSLRMPSNRRRQPELSARILRLKTL